MLGSKFEVWECHTLAEAQNHTNSPINQLSTLSQYLQHECMYVNRHWHHCSMWRISAVQRRDARHGPAAKFILGDPKLFIRLEKRTKIQWGHFYFQDRQARWIEGD
jgi:hypothetical protein